MKYIVTGGGSGGHIYPLLSFIEIVQTLDTSAEFLFVGKKDKMEAEIVPAAGIPFAHVASTGTKGKISWQNVKAATSMFVGFFQAKKIIKDFQPDFCIGAGGYVSVPVMMAAQRDPNIVTAIFESDQFIGRANLQLAKKSDVIFSGLFNLKDRYFAQNANYYHVGAPRSESLAKEVHLKPVRATVQTITFIGGSLGAEWINTTATELATALVVDNPHGIQNIMLITGARYFKEIEAKYGHLQNLTIYPFVEDMAAIYQQTDILVTRSGAGLLAEAATYALPTILVPSPHVANNHQHHNATYFTSRSAAILCDEKTLRQNLSDAMHALAPSDAVTTMYKILNETKKEKDLKHGTV